jgi:NAD(P)-dependent dehydrogenase (short-subunit alcohol dehydrogenase family)
MSASEFNDKVALITGSSSGIGAELAVAFVKQGAKVVITGRDAKRVKVVADKCIELTNEDKVLSVVADVKELSQLTNLVNKTIEKFGQIDVLVNNAAQGQAASVTSTDFNSVVDNVIDSNLKAVLYLTNLCSEHLIKTRGSVVNISSILGQRPTHLALPYCVTKAGLDMATKGLALELGPKGVRVNGIRPAVIETYIWSRNGLDGAIEQGIYDHAANNYPLGRHGQSADLIGPIMFLASSAASFVTGATLNVDGGFLLTSCGISPSDGMDLKPLKKSNPVAVNDGSECKIS